MDKQEMLATLLTTLKNDQFYTRPEICDLIGYHQVNGRIQNLIRKEFIPDNLAVEKKVQRGKVRLLAFKMASDFEAKAQIMLSKMDTTRRNRKIEDFLKLMKPTTQGNAIRHNGVGNLYA
jgi:hypothetical protein